ncbi:transglycosylase domain-containing protein [Lactobacillus terrae]|uniref:transglycosylase domain-containing protein n=1 Tax=Lactobacillus terrae TaxID=2269374 RepID=UPI000C1B68FD|nr:transglycosylase domain-containing protein [Lactobacillus terrae]
MREQQLKKNKVKGSKKRRILWVLFAIILIFLVSVGIFWIKNGTEIKNSIRDGYAYSQNIKKDNFEPKNKTLIYDKNHQVIKKLSTTSSIYTKIDNVNPLIKNGLVQVEDKRFYSHHGVDIYGIGRAAFSRIFLRRQQGGSTLTQQLVKNIILKDQSQTSDRKIKEMVIAQEIEKKFSKQQILEFYINNVYMGHGNYGFSSASEYYFSKDQSKLSIDQLALLIGLPNNQTLYDPVINPNNAKYRRNVVLKTMLDSQLISNKEYKDAVKQPIKLKINQQSYDNDISKDYAINYAIYNATEELMKSSGFTMKYKFDSDQQRNDYNASYQQAFDKARGQLLSGGYSINSTIDMNLQNQVVKIAQDQYKAYTGKDSNGKLTPQLSSTVVDNKTGDVIAIVGGRSTDDDQVNRAISGYRQPGSSAKPIVAYAPAFERGYFPQSTVEDSKIDNIKNWYEGFKGKMDLRSALENSVNTVAYKLAVSDTKHSYYDDLLKMEFARLSPQDNNPIIAIGGFTYGTTTNEMASAYSTLARGGKFIHPSNLNSIYDSSNNRYIYQNRHINKRVYSPESSYMTINIMQSVITDGLGKGAALSNYGYTAGKTGTTDDTKDSYFVGSTPEFTIANWTGNDTPSTISASEQELSMQTFKAEGEYLVDYLKEENKDFTTPSDIKKDGQDLKVVKSKKKQSTQDKITTKFDLFNKEQRKDNNNRLDDLDYRIIYHLTKKEEKKRESKVKKAISKYKKSPFTKKSQYKSKLETLQKIGYLNANVKHQKAKIKFSNELIKLQKELNFTQAQLLSDKDAAKLAEIQGQIDTLKSQKDSDKKTKLAQLNKDYQDQLAKVKTAYKNDDDDKEAQKKKLEDIMDQIRSYGGSAPDITINVDN